MHTITIDQMKQVLEHGVLDLNEAVMFVGQFGAGKTAAVAEFCRERGRHYHPVLLGQYDTVDLKGTPWAGDLGGGYMATVWHPASTLPFKGNPNFPTDRPIILFLDEITSATVPVMGVCYQVVNERRLGEHELLDNVYIVCAGNRESDKGIVTRMPMPLCNRMTWYEIGVNLEVWCAWCQKAYGPAGAIFVAFLNFRKPLICTWDPAKPEKCVATPRTIEKAIRYFLSTMPHDIKVASMAGAVGDGWTAEFWGFHDSWKQISKMMAQIHKDPLKAPVPDEASLQYAAAIAISGSMNQKTVAALYSYLVRMPPEFVVLAWQMATKRDRTLYETQTFVDFSKRFKGMLN